MSLTVKTQASPAAATDFTVTVPTGKWWKVQSAHAKLTTDGTAGTRAVKLMIDDGTNTLLAASDPGQSASVAADWNLLPGATLPANATAAQLTRFFPISEGVWGPGFRFRSVVTGYQAGDLWSEIALHVEEYSADPTPRSGRDAI